MIGFIFPVIRYQLFVACEELATFVIECWLRHVSFYLVLESEWFLSVIIWEFEVCFFFFVSKCLILSMFVILLVIYVCYLFIFVSPSIWCLEVSGPSSLLSNLSFSFIYSFICLFFYLLDENNFVILRSLTSEAWEYLWLDPGGGSSLPRALQWLHPKRRKFQEKSLGRISSEGCSS